MNSTFKLAIAKLAKATILSVGLTLIASPAFAHDDETLDKMKSPNGGQVRMAGMYHFELVMNKESKGQKEETLTIYVTDHISNKIATKGATGTATILSGKNKTTVKLTEDGDNKLKASAKYVANANVKVVLAITMEGKPVEQARYTPFKVVKDAEKKKEHEGHVH